ncbi:MAG: signal peptidase I [Candidatus Margulisbacteria bacterium]|nr:signal peptidase I [Candidatus Margulisiibacteriota bacterium]MBU1021754.1 signal peptidase I [Candidatus Margulisiibacteriota bacterium]MBU1729500.1 signal peptidase I [Candidatus Margulisiibacteriota bacterium]MBU1955399.1 signal peptidase I [Candidatus Margulisiibacteriota bacterium]
MYIPFISRGKDNKKHWLQDTIETIVIALVLALLIRTFIVAVFWIPSGSMIPTLGIKDRIVANKFIFRFREPRRQEIVVFKSPDAFKNTGKNEFIKRLIGLPGDKLQIIDGVVFINDKPLQEFYPLNRDHDDFGPVTVPADHYFMMGDNRSESADSRYWGYLPREKMVGPAFLRIWPLNKFGVIW